MNRAALHKLYYLVAITAIMVFLCHVGLYIYYNSVVVVGESLPMGDASNGQDP